MDVYCPKCSEPFDADEFHDWEGRDYETNRRLFFAQGCEGMGMSCNIADHTNGDNLSRGQATAALAEILGDDVDAIASALDDFGYLFD